jgi:hypothetical protein
MEQVEFEFPDEKEAKAQATEETQVEAKTPDIEIEIEDDTPPKDRNRPPVSEEEVKKLKLDADELDQYSVEAKDKLIKMKKVWHDERRAKESADRERQEAVRVAQKLAEENRQLKSKLHSGEEEYVGVAKHSATQELEAAKKEYRDAYDAGDSEKLVEAQEKLTMAKIKVDKLDNYNPIYKKPVEDERNEVQISQQQSIPRPDNKAVDWQQRNEWFGQDEEMTSLALGLHEKLKRNGITVGSDEYYDTIDKTMRRRFPESFEYDQDTETEKVRAEEPQKTSKPKASTVVAPASRSTSPKKIRLSNTQVALAKKLGLTPEQYARELTKLEAQNG